MAVAHDPNLLVIDDLAPIGEAAALGGGAGPEFFSPNLLSDGWTVEVLFSLAEDVTLLLDDQEHWIRSTYSTNPATFPVGECIATMLEWSTSLGVPNKVESLSGFDNFPATLDGLVVLEPT